MSGLLWLLACTSTDPAPGPVLPPDTDPPVDTDTASTPPHGCALSESGSGALSWSVDHGAELSAELSVTLHGGHRLIHTLPAASGGGSVTLLPHDMSAAGLSIDGEPVSSTYTATLSARDASGGEVCAATLSSLSPRPSPLTPADDPVIARTTVDDPSACAQLMLEVWRPATGSPATADNANQLRLTHPCSGSVLAVVSAGPSVMSSAGLNNSTEVADAAVHPDGTVYGAVEVVPGLQSGVLLELDLTTGSLARATATRTASGQEWDGAALHHGFSIVSRRSDPSDFRSALSLAWSQETVCGEAMTSSLIVSVEPETAMVSALVDPLQRSPLDCSSVDTGGTYHYYANSLSPATLPGPTAGSVRSGACLTINDNLSTGQLEGGGLVICIDEDGEMLAIAQEGIRPYPFSPAYTSSGGARAQMPPLMPFLHAATARADASGAGMTLVTLSLGDQRNVYEDPRIQVMRSDETLSGGPDTRVFETVCVHDITDQTGLQARHHSGVSFLSDETLAVHYSRGDAPASRFTLDVSDCTVTSSEQTAAGASASSTTHRHLKWAHAISPALAEQAWGIRVE